MSRELIHYKGLSVYKMHYAFCREPIVGKLCAGLAIFSIIYIACAWFFYRLYVSVKKMFII